MTTSTVSTAAALAAALKSAKPGDTITLAAGTYPVLTFSNLTFAEPRVTIKAAPSAKVVVGQLTLASVQGLNFAGLEVMQNPLSAWQSSVYASSSSRLGFDGLHIHSFDGSISGTGFSVRESSDITLTNSELDHLAIAVSVIDSQRIGVLGNSVHDVSTDGMDFAGADAPSIVGNRFTDFAPAAGVHPDAIQFWGTTEHPQPSGAVVKGNVITRGKGQVMQGIFVEAQANMTIVGNGMVGTMYNGISISSTSTALLSDNFVQGASDMASWITVRGVSSNITVDGNTGTVSNIADGGVANPGYVDKGNAKTVGVAQIVGGSVDTSALDAWVKSEASPVVVPPVTPPVVVDPRDAQLASLARQLTISNQATQDANTKLATITAKLTSDDAALAKDEARLAAIAAALK